MKIEEVALPLVEERAVVGTRRVESGRVQVRTRVDQREELVEGDLVHEEVEIHRVPVGRHVEGMPEVRQDGDVTIVPVVEEVLVVEKRLMLVEEIHLRRVKRTEHFAQPVTVAVQRAEIARHGTSGEESKPTT